MYSEARKLHIIEDLLKTDNDVILTQVELLLKQSKKTEKDKNLVHDKDRFKEFVGIWTEEEADEISRIIEESCGTVNPEDWK